MSENFYNETWRDNFASFNYTVAHSVFSDASIVFGVLWSFLPIVVIVSIHRCHDLSSTTITRWWRFASLCWFALLCLFVGSIILTKYAESASITQTFDYLGPMRVKGTNVTTRAVVMSCGSYGGDDEDTAQIMTSTTSSLPCGSGLDGHDTCCVFHEAVVQVQLEWGYDWACPHVHRHHDDNVLDSNLLCTSVDVYEPCTTVACKTRRDFNASCCSPNQLQHATNETRQCAEMLFRTDLQYPTNYSPKGPPGNDWPTWLAFGDCNTCTSRFIVPSNEKIVRLKRSGCAFVVLGGIIMLLLFILLAVQWKRSNRRRHNDREHTTSTTTSPQTQHYGSIINGSMMRQHEQQDGSPAHSYLDGDANRLKYQNAIYSPDFDY